MERTTPWAEPLNVCVGGLAGQSIMNHQRCIAMFYLMYVGGLAGYP